MATTLRKIGRLNALHIIIGGLLLALGILTISYSVWAFRTSRAYLDEVELSGQTVEAYDAANYLMTNSGLYLLVGVLLVAIGGLYLTRPNTTQGKDAVTPRNESAVTITSKPSQSATSSRRAEMQTEEDELDELLSKIDDTP